MRRASVWLRSAGLVALVSVMGACGSESRLENPVEEGGITIGADLTQGLMDGQTITVTVVGLKPTDWYWVVECVADDLSACWTGVTFDTFGIINNGTAVIDVRRKINGIDCAERPGRCVVRLASGDEVAVVPNTPLLELSFNP